MSSLLQKSSETRWLNMSFEKNLNFKVPQQKVPTYTVADATEDHFTESSEVMSILKGRGSKSPEPSSSQQPQPPPSLAVQFRGQQIMNQNFVVENYMERAKQVIPMEETMDLFFSQIDLTRHFGLISKIRMRAGFDAANEVWRIYVRKDYNGRSPSIINFLMDELKPMILYLETEISKIENALQTKQYPYKEECIRGDLLAWVSYPSFWNSESVYNTEVRNIRARTIWTPGNIYCIVFNNQRTSADHDDYVGPRIVFRVGEARQLLSNLQYFLEIVSSE